VLQSGHRVRMFIKCSYMRVNLQLSALLLECKNVTCI